MKGATIRRMVGASILLVSLVFEGLQPVQAQTKDFDVPAQSATTGIPVFARQAGIQILVSEPLVRGKRVSAVAGSHSLNEALVILLNGTGLMATSKDGVTYTVAPARDPPTTDTSPAASLLGQGAMAADSPEPAAATAQPEALEQIIVTARRRDEDAQKVPIVVTVVSQGTLEQNNIQTLAGLRELVPALSAQANETGDDVTFSIRGQGTNATNTPGVVVYLNEVPLTTGLGGANAGGPGLLFDLQNVQVLEGPQGTLFGRNSVGGDVLLQTARPTNEFGGHVQLGYGNHNDEEVDAAINLPLIDDKLLARFAINGQLRDGYTRVLAEPDYPNGVDANNRNYWSARGTVTFRPDDRFQNDTVVTYSNYKDHGSPEILEAVNPNPASSLGIPLSLIFPTLPGLLAQQQALGDRTALPIDMNLESNGSFLGLNNLTRLGLTDDLTFRNIFGYTHTLTSFSWDLDGTNLPILDALIIPQVVPLDQYTEEAQLLGNSFSNRLTWIIGGFFLDERQTQTAEDSAVYFYSPSIFFNKIGASSEAIFSQGTYDLSNIVPNLKLTGGLRYTWDQSNNLTASPTAKIPLTNFKSDSSALTWTSGLEYQVAPGALLYLTASRGYRPGGYNSGANQPPFGPEYVVNEELGIKSNWNAGNVPVLLNADVYHQDYSDIQIGQIIFVGGTGGVPTQVTQNAGQARIVGAEFSATAMIGDSLKLGASFAYTNFRYTHFGPGTANVPDLLATVTAGRPPYSYVLSANYRLPMPSEVGNADVQANWSWQDANGDTSSPYGMIPTFGLLNMNADWNHVYGSAIDVSLFGSNLLNKVYEITAAGQTYTTIGFADVRFGEPRMYGIRIRYHFGGNEH